MMLNTNSIKMTSNYAGYTCPACGREGLPSIFGDMCTGCANIKRGFSVDQPFFIKMVGQQAERVRYANEKI